MLFLAAVINITGLYLLAPVVKRELKSFLELVRTGRTMEPADTGDGPAPEPATKI